MTQQDRDRLVVLKKARKKLITQKEAAVEIGITERQVRRLLPGYMVPSRWATAAASVRLRTSSLARIRDTWTLAVFSLMYSCVPT